MRLEQLRKRVEGCRPTRFYTSNEDYPIVEGTPIALENGVIVLERGTVRAMDRSECELTDAPKELSVSEVNDFSDIQ